MSINDVIKARIREHHEKELERWHNSIPKSVQGYDLEELLDSQWNGRLSVIGTNAVRRYLKDPTSFLILQGSSGLGKTVMGVEICSHFMESGVVQSALYKEVPMLLGELSYASDRLLPIEEAVQPDILLLDDIGAGTTETTSTRQNGIWSIINRRWAHEKLTVLTTNLPITSEGSNDPYAIGLQEWFGDQAWDRISSSLTHIPFKGRESMRKNPV